MKLGSYFADTPCSLWWGSTVRCGAVCAIMNGGTCGAAANYWIGDRSVRPRAAVYSPHRLCIVH